MYLLDTNPCVEILRNIESPVRYRLQKNDAPLIYLCSVVVAELLYGARKSASVSKNLSLVRAFCAPFVSLPFDDRCAEKLFKSCREHANFYISDIFMSDTLRYFWKICRSTG